MFHLQYKNGSLNVLLNANLENSHTDFANFFCVYGGQKKVYIDETVKKNDRKIKKKR